MSDPGKPSRTDLRETLDTLRDWWRALSPAQQSSERQGARGAYTAAEISIDADGHIWFEVIER